MLVVVLWLSFLYGSYNGAMVVALTEDRAGRCPHGRVLARLSASRPPCSAASRPLVSTWLISVTGDKAAPGSG